MTISPFTNKSSYGYFDHPAREFVITDPRTPTKWINYIGTLEFGGIIDQTGGALLCAGDPGLNRITKYVPQLPASDFRGTTLYVRIKREDEYETITPFYTPGLREPDYYACHVGLGYQRIVCEMAELRIDATIFIPRDKPVEIRQFKVTNLSKNALEIDLIPVVEYSHFDALKQFSNADWVPQTMQSESSSSPTGKNVLFQYAFMKKDLAVNFFSSSTEVQSFETDRALFLGNKGCGSWADPKSLKEAALSNTEAQRGDNIGALLIPLGSVAPNETKSTATFLGQKTKDDAFEAIDFYSQPGQVEQAFSEMKGFWEDYLGVYQCETPNDGMNALVNVHNARQCYMTLNWSRYLSLYQLGIGTRGLGMRDSSQDVLGAMAGAPDEARTLIEKLLSIQLSDGSAMHQFYPATMVADHGDAEEEATDKKIYGDDHLWIIQSVCNYLKQTGDYAFLDKTIKFYDGGEASVFTHLQLSLEYSKTHTGEHGLPYLGFADWNDCVNLPGPSESMFNACLYGKGLLEIIDLCEYLENPTQAAQYRLDHTAMKKVVNECWDGDWYVRYYDGKGSPIGSKENSHGSLYTNGQSWPVIAGFAPEDRALNALDSVKERHNTKFGIMLSSPGYNKYEPEIGGVTTYPPGAKENGGIFLHSNPWVIIAETMMGRGTQSFEYYDQISPAKRLKDADLYEIEPYCYAQNILGNEHPQFGLGRNSWLSGTASWMYVAATQYILGIRPEHRGIKIDPCIPADWEGYKVTRILRGATYVINVKNPHAVQKGVKSIRVNGENVTSSLIPYGNANSTLEIEIEMG